MVACTAIFDLSLVKLLSSSELEQLQQAYLGEIYGIAFFDYFICHYSANEKQLSIFKKLHYIEIITKAAIETELVEFLNIDLSLTIEMKLKGILDAKKWITKPWSSLIDTMVDWVKPYQTQYHQQRLSAEHNKTLFGYVDAHETAIFNFLLSEQKQESKASKVLDDFINTALLESIK